MEGSHLHLVFGIRRSTFLCSFYIIFYAFYLITGGFMFTAMEAPTERAIRQDVKDKLAQFVADNPCVSNEALENLILVIAKSNDKGVSAVNTSGMDNSTAELNWNFGQALFFAATVVTTIGYGHVTPLTKEGKLFCILYALLGIPLTLTLFSTLVERLMIPSTKFLKYLVKQLGHRFHTVNIRLIHILVIVSILVTVFIFLPAFVFTHLEPEWDYLDSLYYCFISLTTIGLGDYIPGDSPQQQYRPLYKVVITVYLLTGLVFLMFALTVFYDIPQLNVGTLFMMQADERRHNSEKVPLISKNRRESNCQCTISADNDQGSESKTFYVGTHC